MNNMREKIAEIIHLSVSSQLFLLKHKEVQDAISDMNEVADRIIKLFEDEQNILKGMVIAQKQEIARLREVLKFVRDWIDDKDKDWDVPKIIDRALKGE